MARLNVNGKPLEYSADEGTPLLWVLREQLGLTGTKYGCGSGDCGARGARIGPRAGSHGAAHAGGTGSRR